jgi:hypothetical protein
MEQDGRRGRWKDVGERVGRRKGNGGDWKEEGRGGRGWGMRV